MINIKNNYAVLFFNLIIVSVLFAGPDPTLVKKYADMMANKTDFVQDEKNIGDTEVEAIAEALKENRSVAEVDLRGNLITDKGAKALAEALKSNDTVKELKLSFNCKIKNAGIEAIAETLKVNNSLINLELGWLNRSVNDSAGRALEEALKRNLALKKIWLEGSEVSNETLEGINKQLEINKTINDSLKNHPDLWKQAKIVLTGHYDPNSQFTGVPKEIMKQMLAFVLKLKIKEIKHK